VGYDVVLSHTMSSLSYRSDKPLNDSSQRPSLPLKFSPTISNATMIISHFVASTRNPCLNISTCNCSSANPQDPQWDTSDDLLLYPGLPGFDYYRQVYGLSQTSRISITQTMNQLKLQNNQLNCSLRKANPNADVSNSDNNTIVIEMFYDQPQLLGAPLLSNPLTNPIPLYTHTAMRIVTSRDTNTVDTIGPVCEVYPIAFHQDIFAPNQANPPFNMSLTAYEGSAATEFNWVTWNPAIANNSAAYIESEFANLRKSINDFTHADPAKAADHSLSLGDWISTGPNPPVASAVIDTELQRLAGRTILVPIYSGTGGDSPNSYYIVSHFARILVNQVCIPTLTQLCAGQNKRQIRASFVEYTTDNCME